MVKINDYIYTRDLYRARTYQNGAAQMSDKVPYDEDKQSGTRCRTCYGQCLHDPFLG